MRRSASSMKALDWGPLTMARTGSQKWSADDADERRSGGRKENTNSASGRSAFSAFRLRSSAEPADKSSLFSVGLSVIVREEEGKLSSCLESVRGWIDEAVTVDPGSTGRTREIAKEFGAGVVEFVWGGDFSNARVPATSCALRKRREDGNRR